MRSYEKPTSEEIDAALPLLSSPQHEAYFFSRLDNPLWIGPLAERDVFTYPPKSEPVAGGGVRFPSWPPSGYLARMASLAPTEVVAIFANLATDNTSIIGDLIKAALVMPADIAKGLVPAVSRAAKDGTLWFHFKDASALCVRLADGGEVEVAMTLADALFEPEFQGGKLQPNRWDEYWYKDGLKAVFPVFAEREPRQFLPKLCDWMKASVDSRRHVRAESGSDYSYIWRPAIEEHQQNRDYDFAGVMVGFVRQANEQAIRHRKLSLDESLEIIGRYSYLAFRRIAIHLINEFAEQNPELARQKIMDRELFDDLKYKHEYAMLVGHRLDMLTATERETWFDWIDAGPDMSDFDESMKRRRDRSPTNEERQNRKHYWQFEKLHCVQRHLDGQRRTFYEDMLAQHGEPELADLNSHIIAGFRGNDSPMSVDDLAKLPFKRVVENVSAWHPEKREFFGPNVEALASTFGQYVATSPEVFSAEAEVLVGCPAIYVRAFINQMAEAVKSAREINVPEVLKLCKWVVEQPLTERTTPEQEHDVLVDKDWQWTRDEISQFVENTCKVMADGRPKYPLNGLRESMWQLVSPLCRDSTESNIVHDIAQDDPRSRNYLDLGINSPRGKAVEAALEYAGWVANHIKKTVGKQEIVPDGFRAMPEVREMLEWQAMAENRSFVAMAVIGSRLSLLYSIDREWLGEIAGQLFRLEGITESPQMAQGWAAWNAFLEWNRPHIEYYRLLKAQFAYAVAQSAHVSVAAQAPEQPMNRLGEHLMILYGRGQLGLDQDDGLLKRFLAESNADIRRHAIGSVGTSLAVDDVIPKEITERFQALWEMYWAGPGRKDSKDKPNAWLFGTWFSSGQFPEQWALEQLENFVSVTATPEPDHAVVEQLARIAQTDIARAVRILGQIVRGDREGWRVHGWLDSAREVLEAAMKAGGDARVQAEQVIDYLGRRGHTSFGELLEGFREYK